MIVARHICGSSLSDFLLNPAEESSRNIHRLARYSCIQASMTQSLLMRMSTIAEALELARATGLTASQALYNAQMIRTHSLLLRTAQRQGYIIGGRQVHLLLSLPNQDPFQHALSFESRHP